MRNTFSTTNTGPRRTTQGIDYQMPSCFEIRATGSLPCGDYDRVAKCDSQRPARVTPIGRVRKITKRPKTVRVAISIFEMGQCAAMRGDGPKANPYPPSEQHNEWLDGFESYLL